MDKKKEVILIILVGMFLISLASATDFGYNNRKLPSLTPGLNYSTINVNDSNYLQGYTPTSLWTYFTGLGDLLWCKLTGCIMSGNITNVSYLQGDVINFSTIIVGDANVDGLTVDHITEKTEGHGIVFNNNISLESGNLTSEKNPDGYEEIRLKGINDVGIVLGFGSYFNVWNSADNDIFNVRNNGDTVIGGNAYILNGITYINQIDFGTNTITDGEMTGDWNLTNGNLYMNQQSIYWNGESSYIKSGGGGYLVTDGLDDYMNTTYQPIFGSGQDFSVSVWFYAETISSGSANSLIGGIAEEGAIDSNFQFQYDNIYCNLGEIKFYVRPNDEAGDSAIGCTADTVSLNEWHFGVLRRNATHVALFIDGSHSVAVATATGGAGELDFTGYSIYVGSINNRGGSPVYHFDGNIDEVMFYDFDLSDVQITALFNKRRDSGSQISPTPNAHYRFDDGTADDDKELADGVLKEEASIVSYSKMFFNSGGGVFNFNGDVDITGIFKVNGIEGITDTLEFTTDQGDYILNFTGGIGFDIDFSVAPP